jgi:hypothetical protein
MIGVTSISLGAIHTPFCIGPKPAQVSRARRSWRFLRSVSGSENVSMVHAPSSRVFTTPVCQMRSRPPLRIATSLGVIR